MARTASHDHFSPLHDPHAGQVALKGFFGIVRQWALPPEAARTLLGDIGKSTFYRYQKLPAVALSRDTLERISYLLGIYKALRILFTSEQRAAEWIRRANSAPPFNGRSALDWMLQGRVTDLADVRRYLEAQRG